MNKVQDNLTHIMLGIVGGVTRYSTEHPDIRDWSISRLITRLIVSGFAGFMMYNVVIIIGQETLAVIASGIGGFMGVGALDMLASYLKKRIG